MKRMLIVLLLFAVGVITATMIAGCTGIKESVEQFLVKNPDVAIVEIPGDDGLPEAMGVDKDGDGVVDLDAAGNPIEVPGTRERFKAADEADMNIGSLLGMFGLTGASIAGIWKGVRVIKRLTVANARSADLIKTVDVVRTAAKDGNLSLEKINKLLYEALKELPGMIDFVTATKTAIKKAEIDGKQA